MKILRILIEMPLLANFDLVYFNYIEQMKFNFQLH